MRYPVGISTIVIALHYHIQPLNVFVASVIKTQKPDSLLVYAWMENHTQAIQGNHYTYQRLLDESLILGQRYLRRARKLTEIADDKNIDAEQRIAAHNYAAELERAAHDITYLSPSYLRRQGLLPDPKSGFDPALRLSRIILVDKEVPDEYEKERIEAAGEVRRQNIQRQEQQQQQQQLAS
jgi:hypothetical protein